MQQHKSQTQTDACGLVVHSVQSQGLSLSGIPVNATVLIYPTYPSIPQMRRAKLHSIALKPLSFTAKTRPAKHAPLCLYLGQWIYHHFRVKQRTIRMVQSPFIFRFHARLVVQSSVDVVVQVGTPATAETVHAVLFHRCNVPDGQKSVVQ